MMGEWLRWKVCFAAGTPLRTPEGWKKIEEFRAGDIQLVNNHCLLHDRTGFEDWPEPARRRHLLRVWLAPAPARPLPAAFAERYGSIVPGERGGLQVPDSVLTIPWDAD